MRAWSHKRHVLSCLPILTVVSRGDDQLQTMSFIPIGDETIFGEQLENSLVNPRA